MKGIPLTHIASLDLETDENNHIYAIGAVVDDSIFCKKNRFPLQETLKELDNFTQKSPFLLGHNLLQHDLPILAQCAPDLALHQKPVIDTLFLSPLAFPENPYHRLVKNYKLVHDALNDPVADAKLAYQLFQEQLHIFQEIPTTLRAFYAFCFSEQNQFRGLQHVFNTFSTDSKIDTMTLEQASDHFTQLVSNKVCHQSCKTIATDYLPDTEKRATLAYCVAWLQVAGSNSILPPWVQHHFPQTRAVLRQLRDVPCDDSHCQWCQQHHNPETQLHTYFGFPSFRAQPSTEDGKSLQQQIVSDAMLDRPSLGILPTGGGKSLCFQLPALARFQRRGVLTIVISPLQALMKDQVDNLQQKTSTSAVAALYGLLTPPERGAVLEGIRLGDIGILYISPEQLRNHSLSSALSHREIGCWVFDEAHCLSKWGHDFRPDYLYAARFIKEFAQQQKAEIPPIQCLTATAKNDVKQEICDYFQRTLGQTLTLFEGGVERDNLHFEVHAVTQAQKQVSLHRLLTSRMADNKDACVVYCATRRNTEETATFLQQQDWSVAAFHAGLDAGLKRTLQEQFMAGELRIICATNAFGMGIDKDNVRLVVHCDIPGSLENYLQEAGRAGRDNNDADCVIFYDDNDIENQFRLGAHSQLSRRDIAQLLRGLRATAKQRPTKNQQIILTAGELLRSSFVDSSILPDDNMAQTKVVTAIAWLEKAGLVERNENHTQVFQGSPTVGSLAEAKKKLATLHLSSRQQQRWLAILEAIMSAESDDGFSADQLAQLAPLKSTKEDPAKETEAQRVIRTLYDMKNAGLLSESLLLTAFVRYKVRNASNSLLQKMIAIEEKLLNLLQQEAPDADRATGDHAESDTDTQWQTLSISRLNQALLDDGMTDSNPEVLRLLLYGLSQDGKGMANQHGSLELRYHGQDRYQLRITRHWSSLRKVAQLRQAMAVCLFDAIMQRIPAQTAPSSHVMVEFSLDDLSVALKQDLVLSAQLKDPLAAIDRTLLYLHEQKIIMLQNGLAIFRQAMTITILPETRRYQSTDYKPLQLHYNERVFQIHVMNEYARIGLEKMGAALELVLAYFSEDKKSFIQRYFPRKKGMLERATSQQSHQTIVDDLANPHQQTIVAASTQKNSLILAGPGSGKTRTVVHRCAWLLRVKRIPPEAILILTFNRNAATLLRRRLYALVDRDVYGVTIQTYHSLALRMTGHSLSIQHGSEHHEPDFDAPIREAIALLKGKKDMLGLEADTVRDRLLAGYRFILVDEYQDINQLQYDLISTITGRMESDKDSKLTLLAVGDDDQNIYQFRGANIGFIQRFQQDYEAKTYYLTENYRSTQHIIQAANQLIAANQDRMKTEHPIVINKDRATLDYGGDWQQRDSFSQGRVQRLDTGDTLEQAAAIFMEMQRLKTRAPDWDWHKVAVLSREWKILNPLRSLCEQQGIPLCRYLPKSPPLFRIREIHCWLNTLKQMKHQWLSVKDLNALMKNLKGTNKWQPWWKLLNSILRNWQHEAGIMEQPVSQIMDYYYESLMAYKQNRQLGEGLLLSTVHSAKGMEYEHVFIPDGGWQRDQHNEDERRLYYVAMTRAQKTLTLFNNRHQPNALISTLEGESIHSRNITPPQALIDAAKHSQYTLLTLSDIELSYAGRFVEQAPIHQALRELKVGDELQLRADYGVVYLCTLDQGVKVAKLSKKASREWLGRLDVVQSVEVIALVQWKCVDGERQYQQLCRVGEWEVPLGEVLWGNCDLNKHSH